ncbi:amidohydrolase family protein [Pedobacter sp. Du54]|uniref:amidohydrolase family protein n=1 Tax=Pedobacter anseongensis TaxID=3133439 RepID=UPI003099C976
MQYPIIDTHVHTWNLQKVEYSWLNENKTILNRTYLLDELTPEIQSAGVSRGVLVQAANNLEDTNYMLEQAVKYDWVDGVVAWLPLTDPVATARILENDFAANPYIKGIRHLIHNEANDAWLLQETVLESLSQLAILGIPYDLVGISLNHIETALKVAEKIPDLNMVFDHLNQPPIAQKEKFGRWGQLMQEAACHKKFYAKISGLGTSSGNFTDWTNDDLKPYVNFALENFGIDHCFCGGDWPVALLAGSYVKTWQAYQDILGSLLNEADQKQVLSTNASLFYNLKA